MGVNPPFYGLMDKQPCSQAASQLIVVSKVLQCVANETMPSRKNPFMAQFDDFVRDNVPRVHAFFDQICDERAPLQWSEVEVPNQAKRDALAWVRNHMLGLRGKEEEIDPRGDHK